MVDMRNSRPFDISGNQITYSLQADHNTNSGGVSPRGSVIGNWTNQAGTFGALVGLTSTRGKIGVEGYETIGWTNPNLTNAQCGNGGTAGGFPALGQPCNVTGGNGWRIPDAVPNNPSTIAAGLVPGTVIDAAWLEANNPGLTTEQIGEALIPRLGRPVHMSGDRDRDERPEVEAPLRDRDAAQTHDHFGRNGREDVFEEHQDGNAPISPRLNQIEDEFGHGWQTRWRLKRSGVLSHPRSCRPYRCC